MPIVDGKLRVAIELGLPANKTVARSAMPSGFDATFVFGARIYETGSTTSLKLCAYNSTEKVLEIPFKISSTARTNYILDIYAFENGTTINSSTDATSAFFHGSTKISIPANSISVTLGDSVVKLLSNSASTTGTVELKVNLPSEDYTLSCSDPRFSCTTSAGVATITATIASGSYPVTLKVLKGSDVVYTRNETINVFPVMKSDVWLSGDGTSTQMLEIAMNEIVSTFYVAGSGSTWFTVFGSSAGDDDSGNGSIAKPYATIQKAIDKIKSTTTAATDSYTIYVDGTFTAASGAVAVANFSGIKSGCSITLKGLDATNKATLNGNETVQGITAGTFNGTTYTTANLNLTLENLIVKKCNGNYGGGILLVTDAANSYTISNCEITDNSATNGGGICNRKGKLTFSSGTIGGNTATNGGGIYNSYGTLTLNGGTIGNASATDFASSSNYSNKATGSGGGIYDVGGTVTLSGGSIFYNYAASSGGGFSTNGGTLKLSNGTISYNTAKYSGGISIASGNTTTISGGTISNNKSTLASSDGSGGHGINVWKGTLKLEGGAKIDSSNNIRLMSGSGTDPHLKITGTLTETGTVATIWPQSYTVGDVVLEEDTGAGLVSTNYTKFKIATQSDGTEWGVNNEGKLFIRTNEIYVNSSTGNDTNAGTDASPLLTLQEAVNRIKNMTSASTDSYRINATGTFTATGSTPVVDLL